MSRPEAGGIATDARDTPTTTNDATGAHLALQRSWREWPLVSAITLMVGLLVAFGAVMFHAPAKEGVGRLLGLTTKNEVLTFIGFGLGGLLVALQAAVSYRRAKAMEDTPWAQAGAAKAQAQAAVAQADAAKAQADANSLVERGQTQQRLNGAIEHLGSESVSIRLGGAYELFALAQGGEGLQERVLKILCAHIRGMTQEPNYRRAYASSPSVEVQNLLTLLFQVKEAERWVFEGYDVDLTGSWLNGAVLSDACMPAACLDGAYLQGAVLDGAQLPFASLLGANLRGASLADAWLPGAQLPEVQLQGGNLCRVHFECADLSCAELQGAHVRQAHLQAAHFEKTAFHGAHCGDETYSPDAGIAVNIRRRSNQETDISEVTFSGGLNQEHLDDLVHSLGKYAKARLEGQVGKSGSHAPPDGVITGTYSRVKAEEWISGTHSGIGRGAPTE